MNHLVPFSDLEKMGAALAASGLFGVKSSAQAIALMLVAQSEGLHPATVAQDYDIIAGKATRKTHSVLARFQQFGGSVRWHELTDQKAEATFTHPQGGSVKIAWTFAQASEIGLTSKDNWKKYPRAMLRARCIAEGVRAVFPAAIGGLMVSEEARDVAKDLPHSTRHMGDAEVVADEPLQLTSDLPPFPVEHVKPELVSGVLAFLNAAVKIGSEELKRAHLELRTVPGFLAVWMEHGATLKAEAAQADAYHASLAEEAAA